MAEFFATATPSQKRIYRAVRGAAINVAHAHPSWGINPIIARSIAKRATGTLTAGWPDVLAARESASSGGGEVATASSRLVKVDPAKRGASLLQRRPLRRLWRELARQVGPLKWAGQHERAAALIDVLRIVDAMQKATA